MPEVAQLIKILASATLKVAAGIDLKKNPVTVKLDGEEHKFDNKQSLIDGAKHMLDEIRKIANDKYTHIYQGDGQDDSSIWPGNKQNEIEFGFDQVDDLQRIIQNTCKEAVTKHFLEKSKAK